MQRRKAVRANHSATHLLHEALRQVLGDHVAQKGSLVAPDRLRFDFTHQKPIGLDELARIEDIANRAVLDNTPVVTRLMGIDEAIGTGARALFGEKYSDEVRVVSMGHAACERGRFARHSEDRLFPSSFAAEPMCHAPAILGLITIVSQTSGRGRCPPHRSQDRGRKRATISTRGRTSCTKSRRFCRAPEEEADKRLASLIEDSRKLERELTEARRKLALGGATADGAATCARHRRREISGARRLWNCDEGFEIACR